MSTTEHPITPPPELVQQWWAQETYDPFGVAISNLATQAARWGSDQELEACVEWLEAEGRVGYAAQLRAARRPKPSSQAEQALEQLDLIESRLRDRGVIPAGCIRTALERLKELEQANSQPS